MDLESRLQLVLRGAEEIVTDREIRTVLEEIDNPTAYVGYEPSGFVHIGWLIITRKIEELIEAGFTVDVLLADWHAFINDKFGGDLDKIKACGEYFIHCYRAYGLSDAIDSGKLRFKWASDMADSARYWERVLRVAKSSSLSRIRRAMTVMGRKEEEGDLDTSKFIYPAMQAADIFELEVHLALGGMDQRHAHMLARDAAEKLGWKKPTALHTPLLSSLSKGGRMEMVTGPTGGLDHDAMAQRIEKDLDILVDNETLSEETRSLLDGLKKMDQSKRHRAIEVLIAGKRRVGGKTTILSAIHENHIDGDAAFDNDEIHRLNMQLNVARRELFTYLGVEENEDPSDFKMSKSDPDSGIYLHDGEDDIRRKIKKAWCPEGVPDNPVMEICRMIIFPHGHKLLIRRPEKWGGDLTIENYEQLRKLFGKKQLHPADLKKAVAVEIIDILGTFRDYFKERPDAMAVVKMHARSIGK
jgi:tyrosyl-tRNA synthetase